MRPDRHPATQGGVQARPCRSRRWLLLAPRGNTVRTPSVPVVEGEAPGRTWRPVKPGFGRAHKAIVHGNQFQGIAGRSTWVVALFPPLA